jgi:hypothetical protein
VCGFVGVLAVSFGFLTRLEPIVDTVCVLIYLFIFL